MFYRGFVHSYRWHLWEKSVGRKWFRFYHLPIFCLAVGTERKQDNIRKREGGTCNLIIGHVSRVHYIMAICLLLPPISFALFFNVKSKRRELNWKNKILHHHWPGLEYNLTPG